MMGPVQVPTTRSDEMAPDVVVETQRRDGLGKKEGISLPSKGDRSYGRKRFTSLRPFKGNGQKAS